MSKCAVCGASEAYNIFHLDNPPISPVRLCNRCFGAWGSAYSEKAIAQFPTFSALKRLVLGEACEALGTEHARAEKAEAQACDYHRKMMGQHERAQIAEHMAEKAERERDNAYELIKTITSERDKAEARVRELVAAMSADDEVLRCLGDEYKWVWSSALAHIRRKAGLDPGRERLDEVRAGGVGYAGTKGECTVCGSKDEVFAGLCRWCTAKQLAKMRGPKGEHAKPICHGCGKPCWSAVYQETAGGRLYWHQDCLDRAVDKELAAASGPKGESGESYGAPEGPKGEPGNPELDKQMEVLASAKMGIGPSSGPRPHGYQDCGTAFAPKGEPGKPVAIWVCEKCDFHDYFSEVPYGAVHQGCGGKWSHHVYRDGKLVKEEKPAAPGTNDAIARAVSKAALEHRTARFLVLTKEQYSELFQSTGWRGGVRIDRYCTHLGDDLVVVILGETAIVPEETPAPQQPGE